MRIAGYASLQLPLALAASVLLGGSPLSAGDQPRDHRSREIVLRGFSDSAYAELDRGMGTPVCIRGRISIDTAGVYFALQPIQAGDIIDVGFSRILLGLSNEQARRNNMVNGRRYRLCGTLRDATPFQQCDHDHCKWYELQNAELQRGGDRPRGQDVRRFANRALGGASIQAMNNDRNGDGPAFSGRQGTAQGCEVSDLGAVFRNPALYAGRKFCGEALGIPQRTGITFFPPGYDYPSRLYDVAMFLSDRRATDRLRLSQTSPFRVRLEGRIRLLEECFSAAAEQGQLECTPTRRPIILNVSRVGSALATVERGPQLRGATPRNLQGIVVPPTPGFQDMNNDLDDK
jgi:hypothetical protein